MLAQQQELADIRLRLERLTPREREVMALIVTGRLNKQVADDLGVAGKTIKIHRARDAEDECAIARRADSPGRQGRHRRIGVRAHASIRAPAAGFSPPTMDQSPIPVWPRGE